MSEGSDRFPERIVLGSAKVPAVLRELAETLPKFEGRALESQLQTFDAYLAMLSDKARPELAALLNRAAARTPDVASRQRMEQAAESVKAGGQAAEVYDHQEAMREYAAAHAHSFELTPPPPAIPHSSPATGLPVSYEEYRARIRQTNAVLEYENRGGIGETERWVSKGQVVAWMIVRYFRGENDYDYYVSA